MKTKKILDDTEERVTKPATRYLNSLFDFTFTRFISVQMFPAIYGVVLATTLFGLLYLTVEAFLISIPRGFFYLFVATPITFLGIATITRVIMEFYLVVFRMAENIDDLHAFVEGFSGISETVGGVKDFTKRIPFWSVKTTKEPPRKEDKEKKKRKDVEWPY